MAAVEETFQALYASASDPLLRSTAHETFAAARAVDKLGTQRYMAENGATYPSGPLGHHLQDVAQLTKAGLGLEIAFVDVGGWDHHVNEGSVTGARSRSSLS